MFERKLAIAVGLSFSLVGVPSVAIASESMQPIEMAQASSLNGDWTLAGWGDPDDLTPPVEGTEITATITGDNIAGSGGCNRYTGSFDVSGNSISMGPVAATQRACLEPISDQEFQYFSALNNVETYEINPQGQLVLEYVTDDDSGVLVFERDAVPALW